MNTRPLPAGHAPPRRARARARGSRGTWAFAACAAVLVLPGLLGHPVLSYVASESMVPALHVGDVFLVDPLDRSPGVGQVVLYQSVLKGMPAVHRVVGMQEDGALLTKGDANPGTDQAAGEPPVTPDRVLGVPLAAGGAVLVLPGAALPLLQLGVAYREVELLSGSTAQLLAYAALAGALLLLLLPRHAAPRTRGPRSVLVARLERGARRALPRGVLGRHVVLGALVLLGGVTLYAAAAAHEEVTLEMVVADAPPAGQERSAAPGHDVQRELQVGGLGLPAVVIVEPASPRVSLDAAPAVLLQPGETMSVHAAQRAGSELGLQHDAVRVWRYPAFLPPDAMLAVHRAAPGGPAMLLGGMLVALAGTWALGAGLGGMPARVLVGPRAREALR